MNCSKKNDCLVMEVDEEQGGSGGRETTTTTTMMVAVSDESVVSDLTINKDHFDSQKGAAKKNGMEVHDEALALLTKDEDAVMEESCSEEGDAVVSKDAGGDETAAGTITQHKDDNTTNDVLDLEKLHGLMEQSTSAGDLIDGKDVMLLIGGTGAGKTTTTLYFAGTKFEEVDVDGLDHYEPINLAPNLSQFAVSGGATSVTKTIHATTVELFNNDGGVESVTICDTPGFGDTKGTEMEISNGLGIIQALKRAKSVKPVLVLNHKGMDDSRYTPLRKTLGTVIDMMGRRKDFSPFEYVFTRCEGKSIKRVHRQLAGFQNKLRENAKDILGDNVEIVGVLDALLTDMVEKTNPTAVSIDPTESEAAPGVLAGLWSNRPSIERPDEAFVSFVSPDASNKLDSQVNRMSARMEKDFKEQKPQHAGTTLQQLIRLAEVLPLPQMKIAVEEGKEKAREFVRHIQSEARELVDRIVEENYLDKYKKLLLALREKLVLLLGTNDICDLSQAPANERYGAFVASVAAKLIAAVDSPVEAVASNRVAESKSVLQSSLLRVICLSDTLKGLGTNGPEQACSNVKDKVFAKTQSVLSAIQSDTQDISSAADLEGWRASLLFLLDMYAFFDTSGITFAGMDEGKKALRTILNRLAETSNSNLTRLDEMASSLSEPELTTDKTVSTLHELGSSDAQECRQFVLSFLSSTPLVSAVYTNRQQAEQTMAFAVEKFDHAVASFTEKTADSTQNNAEAIFKRKNNQGIQERINAALELEQIVSATGNLCKDLKKWSQFDWQLDQTDKSLYATRKDLVTFIEEKKKLPCGPEPLLYGPDVVGQKFHDMLVELRAFKIENGHCNVPRKYKNKTLGMFVATQRAEFKKMQVGRNSTMTDERMEALADLDFAWSPHDAIWNCRFKELRIFKEQNGHLTVPYRGQLYRWVEVQRRQQMAQRAGKTMIGERTPVTITEERIAKLDSINFVWSHI